MLNYIEELPNLKDLFKQRDEIVNTVEAKRARLEDIDSEKTVCIIENILRILGDFSTIFFRIQTKWKIKSQHMLTIVFSRLLIITVVQVMLVRNIIYYCDFLDRKKLFFQGIIHRQFMMQKEIHGGHMTIHQLHHVHSNVF